jgi:hypothetical protein
MPRILQELAARAQFRMEILDPVSSLDLTLSADEKFTKPITDIVA